MSNGSGPVFPAVLPGAAAPSLVTVWRLSYLVGDPLDKASRVRRGQRLAAELVHDLQVMLDIRARVLVDGPGELLDVDHVRQVLLLEAQDGERPARTGMTAAGERHDLE